MENFLQLFYSANATAQKQSYNFDSRLEVLGKTFDLVTLSKTIDLEALGKTFDLNGLAKPSVF